MKAKRETRLCSNSNCFCEWDPEEEEDGVAYGDTCPICNHKEGEKQPETEIETLRKTVRHLHGRMDETERRLSHLEQLNTGNH